MKCVVKNEYLSIIVVDIMVSRGDELFEGGGGGQVGGDSLRNQNPES